MTGTLAALAVLTSTALSPTMTAREGSPPARATTPVRWLGNGEGIAPGDRAEIAFKLKRLEEPPGEVFPLIGAHHEPCPSRRERLKRRHGAGEGPAFSRDVRLVMDEELGQHPVDIVSDARPAQGLLDHHAGAEPHGGADGLGGDRSMAVAGQHIVQGIGEVRRGVDEGTVEVEYDGGILKHPRLCHTAPCSLASGSVESGACSSATLLA